MISLKNALAVAALTLAGSSLAACLDSNGSCNTDTGVGCTTDTTSSDDTSGSDDTSTSDDTSSSDDTSMDEDTTGQDTTPEDDMTSEDMTSEDMTGEDMTGEDTTGPMAGWSTYTHPCAGNRTDALWVDDADTFWVGCGTTTVGTGLYQTTDGGETWQTFMENWRVNDIRRAEDGWLYVAGEDRESKDAVARIDVSQDPVVVESVWTRGTTINDSFLIGNFARASDGRAIAESLNGTDIAYRASDDGFWEYYDSTGWAVAGSGFQMLDLTLFDDQFYAAGSRISQPPMVMLPARSGEPYQFEVIELDTSIYGEQWGIAVAGAEKIYTVGTDQGDNVGLLFRSTGDPYDATNWEKLDISTMIQGRSWLRGVCALGDTVVAVGEKQPLSSGGAIVLRSDDSGATWTNFAPEGSLPNTMSNCEILDDGQVVIVGAGGFVGVYTP